MRVAVLDFAPILGHKHVSISAEGTHLWSQLVRSQHIYGRNIRNSENLNWWKWPADIALSMGVCYGC